ncbi:MAG: ABC transporter permease [Verrucomicrobia bacterium]|nr:ABC transporter permease [Verrucomicrobiota bacterium]MCH8513397.1 ABC transporter permease [Kiritimatiellia bacterium]
MPPSVSSSNSTPDDGLMVTEIRAGQAWWKINVRELFEYRDLLMLLVKRDLTAVYKQTILGPLWFIIQPLVTTVVFTVIFGTVAQIDVGEVPHFVFYMSGLVFWNYFAGILNHGAGSLISNSNVLSKVYFPRLIIPLSGVITQLAHLALNFVTFLGFYAWYFWQGADLQPNRWLLFLPVLVLQCALMGLGFGLWVSSLTIKYRDLKFALPFMIQLWMYATPIVYPAALVVTPLYRKILWLNPMTAVVEFGRHGFTGQGSVYLGGLALSWGVTLFMLVSGLMLFNRIQRTFVDTL